MIMHYKSTQNISQNSQELNSLWNLLKLTHEQCFVSHSKMIQARYSLHLPKRKKKRSLKHKGCYHFRLKVVTRVTKPNEKWNCNFFVTVSAYVKTCKPSQLSENLITLSASSHVSSRPISVIFNSFTCFNVSIANPEVKWIRGRSSCTLATQSSKWNHSIGIYTLKNGNKI